MMHLRRELISRLNRLTYTSDPVVHQQLDASLRSGLSQKGVSHLYRQAFLPLDDGIRMQLQRQLPRVAVATPTHVGDKRAWELRTWLTTQDQVLRHAVLSDQQESLYGDVFMGAQQPLSVLLGSLRNAIDTTLCRRLFTEES